ncbi:MAG: hypothetical protein ACLP9S_04580 [Syntrophales bacterium]
MIILIDELKKIKIIEFGKRFKDCLMYSSWIILVCLTVCSLSSCGTTEVHKYPQDWLGLSRMSSDCREVQGTYIDTNKIGYIFDNGESGKVIGRTGEIAAWYAFGLDPNAVHSNETNLKNREFSILFAENKVLVINYKIEGNVVISKKIPNTQWSCGKSGLILIAMENPHAHFDKLPGPCSGKRTSTLYRVGEELIIKITESGEGMLLYVLPWHDHTEWWYRFKASP